MGCDGGTIPTRDELVKTKKKPEQIQKDVENAVKWRSCALSQEALQAPIVSCQLGRLYNKDAILEHILNKTNNEVVQHIKGLKDVRELNLTINPAYVEKADVGNEYKDYNISMFICPTVGIEMNGKHRFCFIWNCGCVLSEKALKEVRSDVCHKCNRPYSPNDIIVLNPADEEIMEMRNRMEARKQSLKSSKHKNSKSHDSMHNNGKEVINGEKRKKGPL